jgi:hypothetical protein
MGFDKPTNMGDKRVNNTGKWANYRYEYLI